MHTWIDLFFLFTVCQSHPFHIDNVLSFNNRNGCPHKLLLGKLCCECIMNLRKLLRLILNIRIYDSFKC